MNKEGRDWKTFKHEIIFDINEIYINETFSKEEKACLFIYLEFIDEEKKLIGTLQL